MTNTLAPALMICIMCDSTHAQQAICPTCLSFNTLVSEDAYRAFFEEDTLYLEDF